MASKKTVAGQEVAKAVGAGKAVALESVDFSDPNRPRTCLEVDFPILPVNRIAAIEGKGSGALKPIYQVSKWWARRRSSVFRSMLIAAVTKAPEDPSHAAKLVWDNYYANHQKRGAFKHLRIADIFMGGGTTLFEGSRLGMQMIGNDLNPVAWFVVKPELAEVDPDEVKSLLADIEAQVKPQIMPYFYCDGPDGERGTWIHLPTKTLMGVDFDPLRVSPEQRRDYTYEGPEVIYSFWSKHGPCQVMGCGHRTPIMTSPLIAMKSLTVKYWEHSCTKCSRTFHVEDKAARLAPDVALFVSTSEHPFSILDRQRGAVCPHCGHTALVSLGKGKSKKVELSLLVHPQWLSGAPSHAKDGQALGGSAQDDSNSSALWDQHRAASIRLLEVRGKLPNEVTCPETKVTFRTDIGTVPKRSSYTCASCGTVQDVLSTVKATGKTGPMAGYAVQAYSPGRAKTGQPNSGKFFAPFGSKLADQYDKAAREWEQRKDGDLRDYWPRSEVPYGFMTGIANGDIRTGHGFTHWWTMFNPRQLLVLAQILKAIATEGDYSRPVREAVLAAFQQYIRNENMFCFWNLQRALEPMFSNNNFHPKMNVVENSVFSGMARGDFLACASKATESRLWAENPWEIACIDSDEHSEKVTIGDKLLSKNVEISCHSSTDLSRIETGSIDVLVTDPPFGGLLHYSELSDLFYVWLRLVLKEDYPEYFNAAYTPKSLEAVANKAREPDDPDSFYQRLLTQCWRESHRLLKPGGLLAFTFHHSEDEPWVAVLESLFDAGFYLEATYPIRSDETKGEGEFGSKTIEYDIIHVCRKRADEPTPVSWGRMRREVMADVRQLQAMLENHMKEGLPAADVQVIRRGKALEYFSRHYGKVYVDEGRPISVKDALVGINQLIDEDADKGKDPPPVNSEPMTRQFLRTFGDATELKRDQLQKFLKGSITTPDEFEQRGWCLEKGKVFKRANPLDFAREWSGKHRRRLTSDLDQALVLIGACVDGSGINASDTLRNENFKPHVALKSLLDWFNRNGTDQPTRNAASRAVSIYSAWAASQATQPKQGSLFEEYER